MAANYDDGSWDNNQDPYGIGYDQSTPQSDSFADQLAALYAKYGRDAPSPEEIQAHRGNPGGLAAVEELLKADNAQAQPTPTTTQTTTTNTDREADYSSPNVGTTYNGKGVPKLTDFWDVPFVQPPLVDLGGPKDIPYIPQDTPKYIPPTLPNTPTPKETPKVEPTPTFTAPTVPNAPTFTAPSVPNAPTPNLPEYHAPPAFSYADYAAPEKFSYKDFTAPTLEEALNDPGYKFRVEEGSKALDRSAAARGVLNTGGTLKNALNYGQNAASQEYQNVWNRDAGMYSTNRANALDTFNLNEGNRFNTYMANRSGALNAYNTNYQTQYKDPYDISYRAATDTYKPQLASWQAGIDSGLAGFNANVISGLASYNAGNAATMAGFNANVGGATAGYNARNAASLAGYNAQNAAADLGFTTNANNILQTAAQNHQTDLTEWTTKAAAGQHQNDMNYLNDWNLYNFDYNKVRNYQNDLWNKLYSYNQL